MSARRRPKNGCFAATGLLAAGGAFHCCPVGDSGSSLEALDAEKDSSCTGTLFRASKAYLDSDCLCSDCAASAAVASPAAAASPSTAAGVDAGRGRFLRTSTAGRICNFVPSLAFALGVAGVAGCGCGWGCNSRRYCDDFAPSTLGAVETDSSALVLPTHHLGASKHTRTSLESCRGKSSPSAGG